MNSGGCKRSFVTQAENGQFATHNLEVQSHGPMAVVRFISNDSAFLA